MGEPLDCRTYLENVKKDAKKCINRLRENHNINEVALIFNSNNDNANEVYVRNKIKQLTDCGVPVYIGNEVSYERIQEVVAEENNKFDGKPMAHNINVIVQKCEDFDCELFNLKQIIERHKHTTRLQYLNYNILDLECLVDNFKQFINQSGKSSGVCTPYGIVNMLESVENVNFEGKNVVIINRSEIIGKPLHELLLQKNATITMCHSKTPKEDLISFCKNADFIFVGVGKPKFFNKEFLNGYKPQYIIDFGINFENGKMVGDVDIDNIKDENIKYTTTPGGTGLTTLAQVIENIV